MRIKILATNDVHRYIMPTSYNEKKTDLPFGTTETATMLKKLRASAKGSVFQIENEGFIRNPSLSYYARKVGTHSVAAITKVIDQMSCDVSILGNREFNYGLGYLKETITSCQQPVLAANILGKDGQPYFGRPYVIIEKQRVKVAILGVTTQYIPHWERPAAVKDLTFKSVVKTTAEYVPKLRGEADLAIVAYHGGFEKNLGTGEPTELLTGENEGYDLLERVPGIDALVTDRQHREIATKLNGMPMIQPGFRGAFVGEIILEIEPMTKGCHVIGSNTVIHPVGNGQPDTEVLALTTALHDGVKEWFNQPMRNVEGDMTIQNPNAVRLKEHPYIGFINNVQMTSSGTGTPGIALFNNEGKGLNNQVTIRDTITGYIYPNTLAILRVTEQDLREALKRSVTYSVLEKGQPIFNPKYIDSKPQYYNYDMYEDIEYTLGLRQPFGREVTKLNYHGRAVQTGDVLEIMTNQYRTVGDGNYQTLRPEKIIREIQVDMTELIAEYLKKHPITQASTNDNFKIIW